MNGRDPNRRVYGSGPLRRVGAGQDRFDKEAQEGAAESPTDAVRQQRQMNAPLTPGGRKSFAASLERFETPKKK